VQNSTRYVAVLCFMQSSFSHLCSNLFSGSISLQTLCKVNKMIYEAKYKFVKII